MKQDESIFMTLLCDYQFTITAGGNLMPNGGAQDDAALRRASWRRVSSFPMNKELSSSKRVMTDGCQIHHVRAMLGCVSRGPYSVVAPRNRANVPNLLHLWIVAARWGSRISRSNDSANSGKLPSSLTVLPRHDDSPCPSSAFTHPSMRAKRLVPLPEQVSGRDTGTALCHRE